MGAAAGTGIEEIQSKIRVRTDKEREEAPRMPMGEPERRREYRFRIGKKDVEKYGPSED